MSVTQTGGIDPGLVHTGLVFVEWNTEAKLLYVDSLVLAGPKAADAAVWFKPLPHKPLHVWIEGYRPRSHLQQDRRMVEAIAEFRKALPNATVLNNTGVKKTVKRPLMEVLQLWDFRTPTHHQDLRSAARIMLLGMLKDKELNKLVTMVLIDHLEGRSWRVTHR